MRPGVAGLLSLLVLASLPGTVTASTAPDAAVGHVRPILDGGASLGKRTSARQRFVILQAWQTDRLRALRAANPAVKVLVYKNLAFAAQLPATHVGPSPSGGGLLPAAVDTSGGRFL